MVPLLPANCCIATCVSPCTGSKFLKSGLQWNKYNNSDIEIFKPWNPQPTMQFIRQTSKILRCLSIRKLFNYLRSNFSENVLIIL